MNGNKSLRYVLAVSTVAAGTLTALPAHADVTVTLVGANCTSLTPSGPDALGNYTLTCNQGPTASCVVTAAPGTSLPSTATSVTLTASAACGTISGWTRNGQSIAGTATHWTDTFSANESTTSGNVMRYHVTSSSGGGDVTVTQAAAPSSTGSWAGTCPGFRNTRVLKLGWTGTGTRQATSSVGGFGNNDIVVAQFTTGPLNTAITPKIIGYEYIDASTYRTGAISQFPCDFTGATSSTVVGGSFRLGTTYETGSAFKPKVLLPNTTYYLNIKNTYSKFGVETSSCPAGRSCNIAVEITGT